VPYSRHQVLMEGPQPRLHARDFVVIFVLIRAGARGGVLLKFAAGLRWEDALSRLWMRPGGLRWEDALSLFWIFDGV